MENQFEVKADEGVSNDRLQEAINSMSFWGSTTGIELDEIIMVFSEALRNRRAKQSEDIVHSGRLPVEHIGYVTRDRKMMIFKDSPCMLPEDVSTLDKLVVLSGQLIKPEEDILSENVALKAELERACGFSVDTPDRPSFTGRSRRWCGRVCSLSGCCSRKICQILSGMLWGGICAICSHICPKIFAEFTKKWVSSSLSSGFTNKVVKGE